MPPSNQTAPNKSYYSHIPKDLTTASAAQLVGDDSRIQWDALYNLKGKQTLFIETTLTTNANLDAELTPNRFLIWIIKQDTVGGWTPTWAVNSDGSKKWKGTAALIFTTTANTYTALTFWITDANSAYLVSGVTGGDIA